jgi:CDP-glycerol glycerophosphotransferase (TagB/SpsB family)
MSREIYYFANQIYQFGHALPLYNATGGIFILKKLKRVFEFKKHFKGISIYKGQKSFLNTPRFILKDIKHAFDLEGVIISMSNSSIRCNPCKCKTIYIGHGMGDKKFGKKNTNEQLESYDYHFISGPKHLEKLRDSGVHIPEDKLVEIGNLRFDDYINHPKDRHLILKSRGVSDTSKKTILFAPTWRWGSGTLQKYSHQFARDLTSEFNLIIRPHSHDRKYIPGLKKWAARHKIKNIYFSDSTDIAKFDIMDDFLISDLMIGDTSSILYEYLITKKPIIVVQNDFDDLHTMPDKMNIMKYVPLYHDDLDLRELVKASLENHEEKKYSELLHNCFSFNDGKSVKRAVEFINSIL